MIRVIVFLIGVLALASGLSWLADRPGLLVINWQGYLIETSVFLAVIVFALLVGLSTILWSAMLFLWRGPAVIGGWIDRRRQERGMEALSSGMIAIGAGDRAGALRYANQARKALPSEPMTHLLRAQAAQLSGDQQSSRRIFEAMLGSPETEQLGLRGLFLEADREGNREAARQFAERAIKLNPKLTWPVDALFEFNCRNKDWSGALEALNVARRNGHLDRSVLDRRRAVLMTARAQELEESDPERARQFAQEAHRLAPDLVPAAAIAARVLAARGATSKAVRIVQRTWRLSPHPDLAVAYAYARLGDSPRDRLERVKQLAAIRPHSVESPIAVATAAIEAKDWSTARHALNGLSGEQLTQRVCSLMARIEGGEAGDTGRVREWLARALHAPRDPAWTADGVVSENWAPVSPVTGVLDAFEWRVPVEVAQKPDEHVIAQRLEEFARMGVGTGGPGNGDIKGAPVEITAEAVPSTAASAEPQSKPVIVVEPVEVDDPPKPAQ